jgi:hypothetical protein
MSYEVEILADSICETAPHRLTTILLKGVSVHAHYEILRHRMFSFSVASTRAIPLRKQIRAVKFDTFVPDEWGSEKSGMQAGDQLTGSDLHLAYQRWLRAKDDAVEHVESLERIGLHKQTAARLLMPFARMDMVITGCSPAWMNFFALRCSRAADPSCRKVAVLMADAYRKSTPRVLKPGWWHLPYVTSEELDSWRALLDMGCADYIDRLVKFSVARCARVSFLRHGTDNADPDEDIKAHDRHLANGHWSTFEHQAQAPPIGHPASRTIEVPVAASVLEQHPDMVRNVFPGSHLSGNLPGWIQYRKTLQPNVHTDFDFSTLDTEFAEDLK